MRTVLLTLFVSLWLVTSAGEGRPDDIPTLPRNETGPSNNGPGGRGQEQGPAVNSTDGSPKGQGGGPPRGDDQRARSWGAPNARNETEFDDRKSPRRIAFLGKSANFRIFPNYSDNSTYLQLRFGRIAEVDAAGQPVSNHKISSLADASDAVTFTSGNRTLGNGVNASFVNVTLRPLTRGEFRSTCGSGGGSQSPAPPAPAPELAPRVSVELLFGLDDAVTLPYGDANITVPRNGLKWTISYANWPFCNDSNSLSISLDLLLPGNASATSSPAGSSGSKTLALRLGHDYNASMTFLDFALDGPSGSTKLPVNVTISQKQPVNTTGADDRAGSGSVVTVTTSLPNPKPLAAAGVWYDPTSTTTSVYLSATDPGNAAVAVTTAGGDGSAGGAAAGLRVTMWAALAAVLLSAFLMM